MLLTSFEHFNGNFQQQSLNLLLSFLLALKMLLLTKILFLKTPAHIHLCKLNNRTPEKGVKCSKLAIKLLQRRQ